MPYINVYQEKSKKPVSPFIAIKNKAIDRDLYAHDDRDEAIQDIADSLNPRYLYTIHITDDGEITKIDLEDEAEAYKKQQAIEQKDYDDYVAEVSSPYWSGR